MDPERDMPQERWKSGWQEDAFARLREVVSSEPCWYTHLAPADTAEDAYLLTFASSLFLKDEAGASPAPAARPAAQPPAPPRLPPVGAPAFAYERCLSAGRECAMAFDAASSGQLGAFHREAARLAGGREAWSEALSDLHAARCFRQEFPRDPARFDPPLAPFSEDVKDCFRAVFRKAVHAFKIGFGLWGRWETA
jgi:hypothetical protein